MNNHLNFQKIYLILFFFIFCISPLHKILAQQKGNAPIKSETEIPLNMESAFIVLKKQNHKMDNWQQFSKEGKHRELFQFLEKKKVASIKKAFPRLKKDYFQRVYRVDFKDKVDAKQFSKEIRKFGEIEFAEKIPVYETTYSVNDPSALSGEQYSMDLTYAYNAFDTHTGGEAIVAIVDDAVFTQHEDLAANIWINPNEIPNNSIDDDGNGFVDDVQGYDAADDDNDPNPPVGLANPNYFSHGTHCAGIAGAVTNNGKGISSIGFNNKILPIKCTRDNENPKYITHAYEGVSYVLSFLDVPNIAPEDIPDVISMSFGGTGYSEIIDNLFQYAYDNGIVCIAAAGNNNSDQIFYPAGYSTVISVANTMADDTKSPSSNYGDWIDISAPGTSIYSTVPGYGGKPNFYGNKTGTSMACPMVAGLVGLMKSYNPQFTPEQLKNCLINSADNIDNQNVDYINQLGTGRINAEVALSCLGECPLGNEVETAPITIAQGISTIEIGTSLAFSCSATNETSSEWKVTTEASPIVQNSENLNYIFDKVGSARVSFCAQNESDILCKSCSYVDIEVICPIDIELSGNSITSINEPLNISYNVIGENTQTTWYINGIEQNTLPSSFNEIGAYTLTLEATNGLCTVSKDLGISIPSENTKLFITESEIHSPSNPNVHHGNTIQTPNGYYITSYARSIVKRNSSGHVIWEKKWGNTGKQKIKLSMVDDENFLCTSYTPIYNPTTQRVETILNFDIINIETAEISHTSTHLSEPLDIMYTLDLVKNGSDFYVGGVALDISTEENKKLFITKYNAETNAVEWHKTYDCPTCEGYFSFSGLKALTDGNLFMYGHEYITDWMLYKINGENGNIIFGKKYTNSIGGMKLEGGKILSIVEKKNGDGYFFLGRDEFANAIVVETDEYGHVLNSKKIDKIKKPTALDMIKSQNGVVVLTCDLEQNPMLVELSENLELLWARRYGFALTERKTGTSPGIEPFKLYENKIITTADGGFVVNFVAIDYQDDSKYAVMFKTDPFGITSCETINEMNINIKDVNVYESETIRMNATDRIMIPTAQPSNELFDVIRTHNETCNNYVGCSAIAGFLLERTQFCSGELIVPINSSEGADNTYWEVDGMETTPPFLLSPGNHQITLVAQNNSCSNSVTKNIYIYDELIPTPSFSSELIDNIGGALYIFTVDQAVMPSNGVSYLWYIDGELEAMGESFSHQFLNQRDYEISLSINTPCNNSSSSSLISVTCESEPLTEIELEGFTTIGYHSDLAQGFVIETEETINIKSFDLQYKENNSGIENIIEVKLFEVNGSEVPLHHIENIIVPEDGLTHINFNFTVPPGKYYLGFYPVSGNPEILQLYLPSDLSYPLQMIAESDIIKLSDVRLPNYNYYYCIMNLNIEIMNQECSQEIIWFNNAFESLFPDFTVGFSFEEFYYPDPTNNDLASLVGDIILRNEGENDNPYDNVNVNVYSSSDNVLDESDNYKFSHLYTDFDAGETEIHVYKSVLMNDPEIGCQFLIYEIDPENDYLESNEENNTYAHRLCFGNDGFYCYSPEVESIDILTNTSVRVNLVEVSNSDKYQLTYRIQNSGSSWTTANTTNSYFVLNNLTPNVKYEFRVRSQCGGDWTYFSYIRTFVTKLCSFPNNIYATAEGENQVRISWEHREGAQKYQVRYKQIGTSTWTTVGTATGNPPSNFKIINNLIPNKTYQFRIRTLCSDGWSPYSKTIKYTNPGSLSKSKNDFLVEGIQLYPNPSKGQFTLDFFENGEYSIKITDINGRTIHDKTTSDISASFDLSHLNNGMYFIHILNLSSGKNYVEKLILQNE